MLKHNLKRYRRYLFEFFGSGRYSCPALRQMDRMLEKYVPYKGGFFVEAGANDGFAQSNTYYFEKIKKWKGILIEPIPQLYEKCVKQRPDSVVFNCALVPFDYDKPYVTMTYCNLMSLVKGARKCDIADLEHVKHGIQIQKNVESYEVRVPARTITSILDEVGVKDIDIFSLDVEGYESNVLKGLDFEKYRPKFMLIEVTFREEVEACISDYYEIACELSPHDVLYRLK